MLRQPTRKASILDLLLRPPLTRIPLRSLNQHKCAHIWQVFDLVESLFDVMFPHHRSGRSFNFADTEAQ
jgi:hypothetical protein